MSSTVIPIKSVVTNPSRKRAFPKGRQTDPLAVQQVQELLGDKPTRRDHLIEYLHLIQDEYRQLSTAHLAALAHLMKASQAQVFEVASFYHHFDIVRSDSVADTPAAPALTVRVCDGIACELAGAQDLLKRLPAILGTDVRVIPAPCVGRCNAAPVAVVNQIPVEHADADHVKAACQKPEARKSASAYEPAVSRSAYEAQGGYSTLRQLNDGQLKGDDLIAELEQSHLRGLGGAGFPAGRKWRIVRDQLAPRLMAINIDEGEPGTFKDRHWLEHNPHQFLEGMLIAAQVVGIDAIYVYLRDEYHALRATLENLLVDLQANPPVPNLPLIELRRGAGAYICGEESAMIESIEGERGMPRLRPPYVAQIGLFGRPTLEHNFETLYWVPEILRKGGQWFASHGRNGRKGLRSFSVSGRVNKPGVHLAPAGITLAELVEEYCGGMLPGHTLYGYLPGGASGGILPASLANVPLDFDTLQPHGCFIGSAAIVVFSQEDSAVKVARNLMRFFRHESCGQCTPCREGTAKAADLMERPQWDLELLSDLSTLMRDASICGLGQAAPNPVDCVVKYFPHELGLASSTETNK